MPDELHQNVTPVTTPEPRPAETPDDPRQRIATFKHRSRNGGETRPRFVYNKAESLNYNR